MPELRLPTAFLVAAEHTTLVEADSSFFRHPNERTVAKTAQANMVAYVQGISQFVSPLRHPFSWIHVDKSGCSFTKVVRLEERCFSGFYWFLGLTGCR